MRNMAFSKTKEASRRRDKTVTRRDGWKFLKPGDLIQQVEKSMGLKKGEKMVKIHVIRVVSVISEPISAIRDYPDDCAKEGFPDWTPDQFIEFFCRETGKPEDYVIQRIEFEYAAAPLEIKFERLMAGHYKAIVSDGREYWISRDFNRGKPNGWKWESVAHQKLEYAYGLFSLTNAKSDLQSRLLKAA